MMGLNNQADYTFLPFNTPRIITVEKIRDFKNLEEGWHYGEGQPFKDSILDNAISIIQEAFNAAFYITDAFPGLSGEVMCTIYHGEHYLEFTIEPDSYITFSREKGDKEICYQEGLSLKDAKKTIREFRKEIWNTYESSTQNTITTHGSVDSSVWLLRIREPHREYPSLTSAAS